jgi:hypothetical protein
MYGGTARENRILEDYEGVHPRLKTRLQRQPDISEAFYWQEEKRTLAEKYGGAEQQVRRLYEELSEWLHRGEPEVVTTHRATGRA